jgi:hypothetical protein
MNFSIDSEACGTQKQTFHCSMFTRSFTLTAQSIEQGLQYKAD